MKVQEGSQEGVEQTKRQADMSMWSPPPFIIPPPPAVAVCSPTPMSELLDAAENREWDKFMVRRLLEGVWYLQRI